MSPEMLISDTPHTSMVDFYSLGCLLYELLIGIPPYYNSNRQAMYNDIVFKNTLDFTSEVTKEAVSLISSLLHKNPSLRLGSEKGFEEIKEHSLFKDFDW